MRLDTLEVSLVNKTSAVVTFKLILGAALESTGESDVEWIAEISIAGVGWKIFPGTNRPVPDIKVITTTSEEVKRPPGNLTKGQAWKTDWTVEIQRSSIAVEGSQDRYSFDVRLLPVYLINPSNNKGVGPISVDL